MHKDETEKGMVWNYTGQKTTSIPRRVSVRNVITSRNLSYDKCGHALNVLTAQSNCKMVGKTGLETHANASICPCFTIVSIHESQIYATLNAFNVPRMVSKSDEGCFLRRLSNFWVFVELKQKSFFDWLWRRIGG